MLSDSLECDKEVQAASCIRCIRWPISFNNRTTVLLIFVQSHDSPANIYIYISFIILGPLSWHFIDVSWRFMFFNLVLLARAPRTCPTSMISRPRTWAMWAKEVTGAGMADPVAPWAALKGQVPNSRYSKDQMTRPGSIMIHHDPSTGDHVTLVCEWDSSSWPNPSLPAITAAHHSTWIPLWFSNQFSLLRPDRLQKSDNLAPPAFEFASYVNNDLLMPCTLRVFSIPSMCLDLFCMFWDLVRSG